MSPSCYPGMLFVRTYLYLFSVLLTGCAAMGVPATGNPDKKVANAYTLFDEQQRPLPAERLIREAIDIYRETGDELGLAEAYRAYGFFFRSKAVEKWNEHYKSNGFLEQRATYGNRYQESIAFFEKSAVILERHEKNASLSNVYLNMGFTYEFANQPTEACKAYTQSLGYNQRHQRDHPDDTTILPEGFTSFEAYIDAILKRLNC